jgi:DNA invertase Pin-like site-specific DNA recombinase
MPEKPREMPEEQRQKLIGLVRVSTDRQGKSGLGLEGQQAAIEQYRKSIRGRLIKTYVEVESGTHDDINSRPQLKAAVAHAVRQNATLVIAKLDRLVRSKVIAAHLKTSNIKFVACDNPHANEFTIDILVAVASDEARKISDRTKDALKAYRDNRHISKRIKEKYDGNVPPEVVEATAGKLGSRLPQCYGKLTPEARSKGGKKSAAKRKKKAKDAYAPIADELMAMWKVEKLTLREIAERLNQEERDDEGPGEQEAPRKPSWYPMKVKRVLDRARVD